MESLPSCMAMWSTLRARRRTYAFVHSATAHLEWMTAIACIVACNALWNALRAQPYSVLDDECYSMGNLGSAKWDDAINVLVCIHFNTQWNPMAEKREKNIWARACHRSGSRTCDASRCTRVCDMRVKKMCSPRIHFLRVCSGCAFGMAVEPRLHVNGRGQTVDDASLLDTAHSYCA